MERRRKLSAKNPDMNNEKSPRLRRRERCSSPALSSARAKAVGPFNLPPDALRRGEAAHCWGVCKLYSRVISQEFEEFVVDRPDYTRSASTPNGNCPNARTAPRYNGFTSHLPFCKLQPVRITYS